MDSENGSIKLIIPFKKSAILPREAKIVARAVTIPPTATRTSKKNPKNVATATAIPSIIATIINIIAAIIITITTTINVTTEITMSSMGGIKVKIARSIPRIGKILGAFLRIATMEKTIPVIERAKHIIA